MTEVVVLLESSERVDLLKEAIAEEALSRAQKVALEEEEDLEFGLTESLIERELNHVRIAKKYSRK